MPSPTAAYRYLAHRYAPPTLVSMILYLHSSKECCSSTTLANATGIHIDTVKLHLRALLLAKQIYIAGWQRTSRTGPPIPLYALGAQKNAPRPEKKTSAAKSKDWRDKSKQDNSAILASLTAWPNLL